MLAQSAGAWGYLQMAVRNKQGPTTPGAGSTRAAKPKRITRPGQSQGNKPQVQNLAARAKLR